MEVSQNFPKPIQQSEDEQKKSELKLLELRQEEFISYTAVGGLITDEAGVMTRMTLTSFAAQLGVDRRTLNNWKRDIPNFWERVDKRRGEIFTKNRITAVWNGLFLRAAKGDSEQAKIILSQFAGWQPPKQKMEVEHRGLGDLVNTARNKKIIDAQEAEIVDGHNS